jgi:hypothetical protein
VPRGYVSAPPRTSLVVSRRLLESNSIPLRDPFGRIDRPPDPIFRNFGFDTVPHSLTRGEKSGFRFGGLKKVARHVALQTMDQEQ